VNKPQFLANNQNNENCMRTGVKTC